MRPLAPSAVALVAALFLPHASAEGAPPCPSPVDAFAQGDGTVFLSWGTPPGATHYRIHRAEGDGPFAVIGTTPAEHPHWTDADVTPGATYSYRVTAVSGADESEGCEAATVTTIPFLDGPLALALAGAGALLGLVALRRRA